MNDRATVAMERAESYEEAVVRSAIAGAIGKLGGWGRFVRRGDRVLVKPNCITGAPPEQPAQTHPAMILEVCRQLRDHGARPFVGDSPAWGSLAGNLRQLGVLEELRRLDVPVVEFRDPVRAENPRGRVFHRLTVDRAALEADAIVNLPKLKAHRQLLLTAVIKNMFGCVSGRRKAWWHVKAGGYENYFGLMLVETFEMLRPAVSILDAVVAMEGNGPARGTPRPMNLVLASADGPAAERVAADLVGVKPARLGRCGRRASWTPARPTSSASTCSGRRWRTCASRISIFPNWCPLAFPSLGWFAALSRTRGSCASRTRGPAPDRTWRDRITLHYHRNVPSCGDVELRMEN